MNLGQRGQGERGKGGGKGAGVVMGGTSIIRIRENTKVIMANRACNKVWGGARRTGAGLVQRARVTGGAAEHKGEVYVPIRSPIHAVKLNSCTSKRAAISRNGGREAAYLALNPFPVRQPLSAQSF